MMATSVNDDLWTNADNKMNWFKVVRVMEITDEAIRPFIETEITTFHYDIRSNFRHGSICRRCRSTNANHCSSSICSDITSHIESVHRYSPPCYKNSDITQWLSDPWEIAKCYMSRSKDLEGKQGSDIDFSSVLNVVINNTRFQRLITTVDMATNNNIFCKGRNARNEVMHSRSQQMTSHDLNYYCDIFIGIVNTIGTDKAEYVGKIEKVRDTPLSITAEDVVKLKEQASRYQGLAEVAIEELKKKWREEIKKVTGKSLIPSFIDGLKESLCRLTREHIQRQKPKCISTDDWTVEKFISIMQVLQQQKNLSESHREMLFPSSGSHLELAQWDIHLYCFVLNIEIHQQLDKRTLLFIKDAKTLRDKLLANTSGVEKSELLNLCDYLDNSLKDDMLRIFERECTFADMMHANILVLQSWRRDEDRDNEAIYRRLQAKKDTLLFQVIQSFSTRLSQIERDSASARKEFVEISDDVATREAIGSYETEVELKHYNAPQAVIEKLQNMITSPDQNNCVLNRNDEVLINQVQQSKVVEDIKTDIQKMTVQNRPIPWTSSGTESSLPEIIYTRHKKSPDLADSKSFIDKTSEPSQEMEPEQKDNEKTVEFYLDHFEKEIRGLLSESDVKKFILHYKKFGPDEQSRLSQFSDNKTSFEIFNEILKSIRTMKNGHLKYTALAEAFEEMGHEKIHRFLTGVDQLTNDIHRRLLYRCGINVCEMNVDQILPIVVMEGVVCEYDRQAIQSKLETKGNWHAAFQLLMVLPNKKEDWFQTFMTILREHQHQHLAILIDSEWKKMDEDCKDTSFSQQPDGEYQNSSEEESSEEEDDEFNRQQDSSELVLKDYQLELAENAVAGKNTVICAGTGTGKTWVALHVVKEHLNRASQGKRKVVFMARTSTLIKQQADRFKKYLPQFQTKLITGENEESSSIGIFLQYYDILCLTPQILANNLDTGSVKSMEELSLIILDECHHTKKDEPYNNLMKKYLLEKLVIRKRDLPQVIGLTASIGVGKSNSDEEALDYMLHLFASLDVRDLSTVQRCTNTYKHKISHAAEELITMTIPRYDPCKDILVEAINETEDRLKGIALLVPNMIEMMTEKCPDDKQSEEFNQWTVEVEKMAMQTVSKDETARNIRRYAIYLTVYNAALELNTLLGPIDVIRFLANKHEKESLKDNQKELTNEDKKLLVTLQSVQKILAQNHNRENQNVRNLCDILKRMMRKNIQDSRAMVFVKARATCVALAAFLKKDFKELGIDLHYLYGKENRGGEDGMTESVQNETVEKFRRGFYKILVATSIGIEGIDVPDCNIVLNYNFLGNEITKIQMKGRSRKKEGYNVIMGNEKLVDHEKINAYKLAMMQRALTLFYKMDPKLIETKINLYQQEEMNKFRMKKENEKIKRERKSTEDDFEIRCRRCNVLACCTSDIRMVKDQYIVIDESFKDRIEIKPHKNPVKFDGFHKKFKMNCKKCPLDWGIVSTNKGLMCRTLKLKSFQLCNTKTRVVTPYKKWEEVPTRIPEIEVEDLTKILSQVQQHETLTK